MDFVDTLFNMVVSTIGEVAKVGKSELMFSQKTIDLVEGVWSYFSIVGIGMTLIYFLLEMNKKYAFEGRDMNIKSMFLPFLKLMLSIIVIANGAKIIGLLISLHNTIVKGVENAMYWDSAYDISSGGFADVGFLEKIMITIPLMIAYLVALVVKLAWAYKALVFKIEYLYRVAITPIALSDVYSGDHSSAIKWLKSFLALALYAVAFIVIPVVAMKIGFTSTTISFWDFSFLGTVASLLVAPIAALGCLSAAKSIAKQALGV